MGFLHPTALWLFALVPALILAYLARERPSRVTVSSVLAFRALRGFRKERYGGRPRFDWMFFAELIILSLAVLAAAAPYVASPSNPIAVVIDNSAAMQAWLGSGGTRFDDAIAKAAAMLADTEAGKVSVYVTAPSPQRIAPPFDSVAEARTAIAKLRPVDAPADYAAVTGLLNQLTSGAEFRSVIFASARAVSSPMTTRLHAIAVGDPIANYALGDFTLRRESFGASALHASLTVANFSPKAQQLDVAIEGDGAKLAAAHQTLAPGETGFLEFASLSPARVYRAVLTPDDGFALDNVAYATGGAVKTLTVLFVSPTPADAAGLETIPGVAVRTLAPDAFTPAALSGADLAVFEYAAPKELPTVNSMLVMPPPGDPVFNFHVTSVNQPEIAGWRKTDPLTDSVNFRLLNLRSGEAFAVHPWMATIVSTDRGGLLLAGDRGGHRYVATGFNPFPYLGKRNLPMSVLTLNMLGYLAGLGTASGGYHTGEPWLVPAGVEKVELPSGRKVAATPSTVFADVVQQGVYQLIGTDGSKTLRAVNLDNLSVSDLRGAPPLQVERAENAPISAPPATEQRLYSGWVLAAIIALAALEALGVYRRRRQVALTS